MFLLAATLLFAPHYEFTQANSVRNAVPGPSGGIYFTSFDVNGANPQLVSLDADGRPVYRISPHPAGSTVASVGPYIADAQGDLYALTAITAANGAQQCMLNKLDPNGNTIYAFNLPQQPDICFGKSSAVAIALGPDGSAFLTGSDSPQSLATTGGAYVAASAAAPNQINAYLVKVNPQGTAVLYSTFLDSAPQHSLVSPPPSTTPISIAVDSNGNAYVAGVTQDAAFPTSSQAVFNACNCSAGTMNLFLMKISPDGNQMVYSTFLRPGPLAPNSPAPFVNLTVDSASEPTITQLPVSTGGSASPSAISVMTLDNLASEVLNSSNVIVAAGSPLSAMPDGQGNLLVAGTNPGANLQFSPGAFTNGSAFAAVVRIADGSVLYATAMPSGSAQSILADGTGGFLTVGALVGNYPNQATQISRFVPASSVSPTVLGVSNVAGLTVSPGLAPGELVSIYGVNLGPSAGVPGAFGANGTLPYNLAGTAVYFNGVPAPLLYAGNQQVNAIVPFGVPGGETVSVTVLVNNALANMAVLPERAADPDLFQSAAGGAFALNQNGTLNSQQNPASMGTVLTFFVSGAGLMTPNPLDGQMGGVGPQVFLPLTASVGAAQGSANLTILYAGSAPTLAAGMVQLNLQLPSSLSGLNSGTQQVGITLTLGTPGGTVPADYIANGTIWVSAGN